MNLLQDNVRKLYFKYFGAAFGSAMVSSIYGLVDTAVVGQSLGPNGTGALAVVAPLWNLIYSLGLLTGIGGSDLYLYVFMKPTARILEIGPAIIRTYALSFLLLPLNVFSTYYFQALMQPQTAFIVSVFRGMLISGALILILPLLAGPDSIWLAMPITELLIGLYVIHQMHASTRSLKTIKQS